MTFENELSRSVWSCIEQNIHVTFLTSQGPYGSKTYGNGDVDLMVYDWKTNQYIIVTEHNCHVSCSVLRLHEALQNSQWSWEVLNFHRNDNEPFHREGGNEWRHM